jgi:hypothetical protein
MAMTHVQTRSQARSSPKPDDDPKIVDALKIFSTFVNRGDDARRISR